MTAATLMKHDSAKFKETKRTDPTVGSETESGWIVSRAQFSRRPPRVFHLGFTDISNADKEAISTLYDEMRGSAGIITGWSHPVSGAPVGVRFKKGSIPSFTYRGYRGNHRWDVSDVVLEEI